MRPALMLPSVVRLRSSSRIKTRKRSPSSQAVERRVLLTVVACSSLRGSREPLVWKTFLVWACVKKRKRERKGCMPSARSTRLKNAHKRYTGNFTLFLLAVMDHIVLKYSVHGRCQTVLFCFFLPVPLIENCKGQWLPCAPAVTV